MVGENLVGRPTRGRVRRIYARIKVSGMAKMLRVSRQRAVQIVPAYPDFPAPEADLASGRVWKRSALELDERTSRSPSRSAVDSFVAAPRDQADRVHCTVYVAMTSSADANASSRRVTGFTSLRMPG
jgi:hypothetical protein